MSDEDIVTELAQIRQSIEALAERKQGRLNITPENCLPHAVIQQSYPVEYVATIAAGYSGESQDEQVKKALKLIERVESLAVSDPWSETHEQPNDSERQLWELQNEIPAIMDAARNDNGQIALKALCAEACHRAGRTDPKTKKPLSEDGAVRNYRDKWVPYAAESLARHKLYQEGSSVDEVGIIRSKISREEKRKEWKKFRLGFEKGDNTQARYIGDDEKADQLLRGCEYFNGFLAFLLDDTSSKKHPIPPRPRDEKGKYMERPRGHEDGKFEEH